MMTLEEQFVAFLQLLLAAFLGGIIGLEREHRQHEAGLRTHMLVCIGSCLFTILSFKAFPGSDPARIASQILPGMGFLGAGSIIKYGRDIQGLTTAASMWFTAAMGMAVATGSWFLALTSTLLVWFVLSIMHRLRGPKETHSHKKVKDKKIERTNEDA
ncbi:MAG: MgtC/SapB family protein [Anaerolineae bacterium]|nr:MgtC/SapB family protein [Anaerolineae bacterium]